MIDPRRISDDLGGEDDFRSLADAARRAGMGIVLDIVPNHMAAVDENPFWADPALRERFFDIDPATGCHRRFFDIDDLAGVRQEDPTVFEALTRSCCRSCARAWSTASGSTIPDGLATRSATCDDCATRASSRCGWRRFSTRESARDWPVCGTVGYEFLNDVCALFVDPGRRATFHRAVGEVSGDRRRSARSLTRRSSSSERDVRVRSSSGWRVSSVTRDVSMT